METKTAITANEVICNTLQEIAQNNPQLLVLTSDSRGSASLTPFITRYPERSVELGIAEQNLVSVAAGLARAGKRPFVFSPAAFLTMRSIEQVKVDVAYSNTNVKLIGISGGNSYSNLGSSHHSLQDLAITTAIPNLEVYTPADRFETMALFEYLATSSSPAYVRVGKRKLPDCYHEPWENFQPGRAKVIRQGHDVCLISAGETLYSTIEAAKLLEDQGISTCVVDLVSIKPLDTQLLHKLSEIFKRIVTIEEHSIIGGLGARVATITAQHTGTCQRIFGFPDESAISGPQAEVFDYYGLSSTKIAQNVRSFLKD